MQHQLNHDYRLSVRRAGARLGLLLALAGIGPGAWAVEDEHAPITVNPGLDLAAVLEHTVAQHPRYQTLTARAGQAEAWDRYGRSFFAGAPTASMRYQSDRLGSNDGLEEWEAGVELPLWRWGQRSRVQQYGSELGSLATASASALRWELAGELRQRLWAIALADARLQLASADLSSDETLLKQVEKRYASGDTSRSELLLARTQQLEASSRVLSAQAMVVDEEWQYLSLTGMHSRPVADPEPQSPLAEVPPDHPLLQLASARIAEAQSQGQVAVDAARDAPTLLLGPRREKAVGEDGFDESLGLTLHLPLGGARQKALARSAADLAVAEARSERDQQRRLLELSFHDAHHELEVTRDQLALSRQSVEFSTRQAQMAQTAYDLGESSLTDLLRERRRLRTAQAQLRQLELREYLLISMYNQAVGVLP